MQITTKLKEEFFGGWTAFEACWIIIFLVAQLVAYYLEPDSLLAMISGIAGVLCVVLVSKGKISNYLFGLIFAYTYFYASWENNYLGEMNTVLYVYLPAQFIGYYSWKANADHNSDHQIDAKKLDLKGWVILIATLIIGTFAFVSAIKAHGGSVAELDGFSTVVTVLAQLLMIWRYREQWLLWIMLNIISIVLWFQAESGSTAMMLMYGAYLLNSFYGYWNWSKLAQKHQVFAKR